MKKESRCVLLAIIFIGVVFEVLYFFKMYPEDGYIVTGGIAVLLFVSYFLLNSFYDLKKEAEEQRAKEQEAMIKKLMEEMTANRNNAALENVEKFEKAIYMALQNGTKAISDEMQTLDNHLTNGIEGIIQQIGETGERVAKINVKYSRENTKSLMVFQQKVFNNVIQGMEETVREVNEMAEKVNNQLEQLERAIKGIGIPMQSQFEMPTLPKTEEEPQEEVPVVPETEEEPQEEVPVVPETEEEPQVEIPVVPESEEELPIVEDMAIPEVVSEPEVNTDPNHVMTPEEIAALVAGGSEEEAESVPDPVEEPMVEVNTDPNHVMTPEEIAALVAGGVEEEAESVPDPVEEPMVEVNTDPNHVMTPEEIAALVAGGSEEEAESVPDPVEEPMVEMNTDPNHVMTPEEIAALISGTK